MIILILIFIFALVASFLAVSNFFEIIAEDIRKNKKNAIYYGIAIFALITVISLSEDYIIQFNTWLAKEFINNLS